MYGLCCKILPFYFESSSFIRLPLEMFEYRGDGRGIMMAVNDTSVQIQMYGLSRFI